MEVQAHYVREFDLGRRHALHLCYWTDGDTRRRGEVLGNFKQAYRQSDILVDTHGELPDYLPMVLEFAARVDLAARPGPADPVPGQPGDAAARPAARRAAACPDPAGRLRDPARQIAGRRAGCHADGRLRAADRSRGAGPVRSSTAAREGPDHADFETGPGAAVELTALDIAPLGRPAVRHGGGAGGRQHLALQVRPVRLDHQVLPAV